MPCDLQRKLSDQFVAGVNNGKTMLGVAKLATSFRMTVGLAVPKDEGNQNTDPWKAQNRPILRREIQVERSMLV